MNFIISTVRHNQHLLNDTAKKWSDILQRPYIIRENLTLDDLLKHCQADAVLLVTSKGPKVYNKDGYFFYHPSMAKLRVDALRNGGTDHLVEAMALKAGMRVLDCTLGLASDAAVVSYVVGKSGKVLGLESSELLHFAVQYGLRNYNKADTYFTDALRRITTVLTDAETFLQTTQEEFDVIYFDPMFQIPVSKSSNMKPLRSLACEKPITRDLLDRALQLAPRVVIKERYRQYLCNLGCTEFYGGKYSAIKYGVRLR